MAKCQSCVEILDHTTTFTATFFFFGWGITALVVLKEYLDILGNTLYCRELHEEIDTTLISVKREPGDS